MRVWDASPPGFFRGGAVRGWTGDPADQICGVGRSALAGTPAAGRPMRCERQCAVPSRVSGRRTPCGIWIRCSPKRSRGRSARSYGFAVFHVEHGIRVADALSSHPRAPQSRSRKTSPPFAATCCGPDRTHVSRRSVLVYGGGRVKRCCRFRRDRWRAGLSPALSVARVPPKQANASPRFHSSLQGFCSTWNTERRERPGRPGLRAPTGSGHVRLTDQAESKRRVGDGHGRKQRRPWPPVQAPD